MLFVVEPARLRKESMFRHRTVQTVVRCLCILAVILGMFVVATKPSSATSLPVGFVETMIAGPIDSPTAMDFAPDGRLFVSQQAGFLRVIKNGVLLPLPFLTVVADTTNERGLMGVAFDPNFATNGYVYVFYTATTPVIHNRVSRFTANGDVAVPGSERVLLDLDPPPDNFAGHNGGTIHFGPDGMLYIAVGDHHDGPSAQSMTSLFGKMLRLHNDGSIPTDNPFYNSATGIYRAIWALGFRNPFTWVFQPGTGRMFINDVGENTWEEIDDGIAGGNYGWPTTEGPFTGYPQFQEPFFYYGHVPFFPGDPNSCAITGGTFYDPPTPTFPSNYTGHYFFADFCGRWIKEIDPATKTVTQFASPLYSPVDLKVSNDGALYYLVRGQGGVVYRIDYTGTQSPVISTQPTDQLVGVGQSASFTVDSSGTAPLTYQWQRNGVDIGGATQPTYTLPTTTLADNGAKFHAVVTNSFGNTTSNDATLTVINDQPPTGTITQPANGTLYRAGDTITYSGTATDPEDGTLPASAYTWEVRFQHNTHYHPAVLPYSGATGGSFVIPTIGETSDNVWYRIILTVKDSQGLTQTSYVDVMPRKSTVTLKTNPPGLQINLDGQPQTAPVSFVGVVGMIRTLQAVSPQTIAGQTYTFTSWSDGGAATHTISTPTTNTTYTANFHVTGAPIETIGVFRPSQGTFYLRNSNSTGYADTTVTFGLPTDYPVVGDWNGDGVATIGVYRSSTGQFFLTDDNHTVAYSFVLGIPGDKPIVGDWTGQHRDGVGVYRPSNGLIYLKNNLATGYADYTMVLGIPGDIPIAGDWMGQGHDSLGVYRPSNGVFYLSDQVCNCSVFADHTTTFGVLGDIPFAGDWTGSGRTGIGVFRTSNGLTFEKNNPTTSGPADITFTFGIANDAPLAGHWTSGSLPAPLPGLNSKGTATIAPTPTVKLAPTFIPSKK